MVSVLGSQYIYIGLTLAMISDVIFQFMAQLQFTMLGPRFIFYLMLKKNTNIFF